ncbi:Rieske 2Fe-2S domain-containing protein [Cupriavidus basilensis]
MVRRSETRVDDPNDHQGGPATVSARRWHPVALGNVCPHRFAPLNMGKLLGDVVQCPYHGLQFNSGGQCVHIPHGDCTVSQKMAVPSYPVVERHKLIWVWMGNPEDADPATIPDFSCHEDEELAFVGGVLEVDANYKLIVDNLMDLSHAATVHEGLLSMPGLYTSKLETIQRGTTVYANKWMPDGEIQPAHAMLWKDHVPGEMCDQWAYMRWDAPAHLLLDVGVTKVGAPRTKGIFVYGTDILTPKDETTTYYFWGVTRNYDVDNEAANAQWHEIIKLAFDGQDKPMIEAQQRVLGERDIEDMNPVMFSADTGSMRARRVSGGTDQWQDASPAAGRATAFPSTRRSKLDESGTACTLNSQNCRSFAPEGRGHQPLF